MERDLFEDGADTEALAHFAVKHDTLAFGMNFPGIRFSAVFGGAGRFADLVYHFVEGMEVIVEQEDF